MTLRTQFPSYLPLAEKFLLKNFQKKVHKMKAIKWREGYEVLVLQQENLLGTYR